ncbi:MAG: hypothetical protein EOO65_03425, partial [Methanosarcinales archaeon]
MQAQATLTWSIVDGSENVYDGTTWVATSTALFARLSVTGTTIASGGAIPTGCGSLFAASTTAVAGDGAYAQWQLDTSAVGTTSCTPSIAADAFTFADASTNSETTASGATAINVGFDVAWSVVYTSTGAAYDDAWMTADTGISVRASLPA